MTLCLCDAVSLKVAKMHRVMGFANVRTGEPMGAQCAFSLVRGDRPYYIYIECICIEEMPIRKLCITTPAGQMRAQNPLFRMAPDIGLVAAAIEMYFGITNAAIRCWHKDTSAPGCLGRCISHNHTSSERAKRRDATRLSHNKWRCQDYTFCRNKH